MSDVQLDQERETIFGSAVAIDSLPRFREEID